MTRGASGFPDSVTKLVHHLASFARDVVTLDGKRVVETPPTRVTIGPSMFRRFICQDSCTACCLKFTIDYMPAEFDGIPDDLRERVPWRERDVIVNGVARTVYTFDQSRLPACPYLTAPLAHGGVGCALWPRSPIECAAAPQVTFRYQRPSHGSLSKRPFGRGWQFTPPAQCQFVNEDDEVALRLILQRDAALLERYAAWADYLGVDTLIPAAVDVLRSYRRREVPIPYGRTITLYEEGRLW